MVIGRLRPRKEPQSDLDITASMVHARPLLDDPQPLPYRLAGQSSTPTSHHSLPTTAHVSLPPGSPLHLIIQVEMPQPFICPLDHSFNIPSMVDLGLEWREHSFLSNPSSPAGLAASAVDIHVGETNGGGGIAVKAGATFAEAVAAVKGSAAGERNASSCVRRRLRSSAAALAASVTRSTPSRSACRVCSRTTSIIATRPTTRTLSTARRRGGRAAGSTSST